MTPFASGVRTRLTWSNIPQTPNYELKSNHETAGVLLRPSSWSPRFLAETREGRWVFRREGFLGTGVEIRDADSEQPIATFQSSCGGGGRLTFADGQSFRLTHKGWWHPRWTLSGSDGKAVLEVHTRERTVDLTANTRIPSSRLPLLMAFAWSRVLQADEDASAASLAESTAA